MRSKSPAFLPRFLLVSIAALLVLVSSCVMLPAPYATTTSATTFATQKPPPTTGVATVITTKAPPTSSAPTVTTTKAPPTSNAPTVTTTIAPPTSPVTATSLRTVAPPTTSTPLPSGVKIESSVKTSGSSENITRRFDWEYKGCSWWYEVTLSNDLYQSYRDRPRIQLDDWAVYATHPGNEWLTRGLAELIQRDAPKLGYSDYDIMECAVIFVQSIPYTTDADTKAKSDYPRFPIETVVDGSGDCEDHAFLLAAVSHDLGYDTILLDYPTHMAVGIAGDPYIKGTYYEWRGKNFYFIETTSTGWKLGELPEKYKGVSATIIELIPRPVYFCTWSYPSWRDSIPLSVTVDNRGSAAAEDVVVHAGCDAGDNMVWNQVKSSSFGIPIDNKATVQLSLTPPKGQHTRVEVWVTSGNRTVSQTYGENWFDTNP